MANHFRQGGIYCDYAGQGSRMSRICFPNSVFLGTSAISLINLAKVQLKKRPVFEKDEGQDGRTPNLIATQGHRA